LEGNQHSTAQITRKKYEIFLNSWESRRHFSVLLLFKLASLLLIGGCGLLPPVLHKRLGEESMPPATDADIEAR
jgi:hypothetical protein